MPLRHVAWASNINNAYVSAYGYGIAITQAACYASMDQLGVAQYITRLAIAFDDLDALASAKTAWLEGDEWQELRHFVRNLMVEHDWFALLVAQDFVIDGLLYPLIYERFNDALNTSYGPVFSMLTRFQREWGTETAKWIDSVLKVAAAESPEDKAQLAAWITDFRERAVQALSPIVAIAFGDKAAAMLDEVVLQLNTRAAKAGIPVEEAA